MHYSPPNIELSATSLLDHLVVWDLVVGRGNDVNKAMMYIVLEMTSLRHEVFLGIAVVRQWQSLPVAVAVICGSCPALLWQRRGKEKDQGIWNRSYAIDWRSPDPCPPTLELELSF